MSANQEKLNEQLFNVVADEKEESDMVYLCGNLTDFKCARCVSLCHTYMKPLYDFFSFDLLVATSICLWSFFGFKI